MDMESISNLSSWCSDGECDIFTDSIAIYNGTTKEYSSEVLLVEVITENDTSLVVISTIRGHFSVPILLSAVCTEECRWEQFSYGDYCRSNCAKRFA